MLRWSTCKHDFERDGSLRDIYVRDTTLDDWQALLTGLRSVYELEFRHAGLSRPLPPSVAEIFATRTDAASTLLFHLGSIEVCCHFLHEEIEFDIDPRQITSQSDLNAVLDLLRKIGDTVGKPVILTPENLREAPIITYAGGQFRYHKGSTRKP